MALNKRPAIAPGQSQGVPKDGNSAASTPTKAHAQSLIVNSPPRNRYSNLSRPPTNPPAQRTRHLNRTPRSPNYPQHSNHTRLPGLQMDLHSRLLQHLALAARSPALVFPVFRDRSRCFTLGKRFLRLQRRQRNVAGRLHISGQNIPATCLQRRTERADQTQGVETRYSESA